MRKIDEILYVILQKEYNYDGPHPDIYEVMNFFRDKLNLEISAVKACGKSGLSEHWNCFIEKIVKPFGIPSNRIIFQDSWSLDFDYEEVINLCIYYYFVNLGFLSPFGKAKYNDSNYGK